MVINIKYRPLKAFLLVAETASFTHAADRLGVSQPSISALIKQLEEELGVTLLERTTRTLSLTAAGKEFLVRIGRPVADIEEAYLNMTDLSEVRRGVVVLGALPSTALTLLPPTLGALRASHPGLQIRIVEAHHDQLLTMLRTNQIEFALTVVPDSAPDLRYVHLVDDAFFALHPPSHPIVHLAKLRWRDLMPYDLVLLSQGSSARARYDHAVQNSTSRIGLRYDVTHLATAVHLVRQGLGITLIPRIAIPSLDLEDLQYRVIASASARRKVGLLHRRDRKSSPAASLFIDRLHLICNRASSFLPVI